MASRVALSYVVPFMQAVLLHIVALLCFMGEWKLQSDKPLPPQPIIVNAKLFTMAEPVMTRAEKATEKRRVADQNKAEQQRLREIERNKAEQRRIEKQRLAAKKQEEQKRIARQQAEAEKKAEAKRLEQQRLAEQKRRQEAERVRQEQLARELEIARALEAESDFLETESNAQAMQSYIGLIQSRIIQNWHRPLSARNGMEAILAIHFIPTGEINEVYVTSSSGDSAFDRSALQAVQRVGKIEELSQVKPSVFDANFRKLRIRFKPEDLDR